MAKILITGASGFVGSWLVQEALSRELEVFAGIRKSSSKQWLGDSRIQFVHLDLSDPDHLKEVIQHYDFDYIIHNAGLTKALKASALFTVNAEYTNNLAQAATSATRLKKFVFMSSMASFGTADYQKEGVVSNDSLPHPITNYGKSKLRAEQFLQQIPNLPVIIFRPTGIFGPRESDFLQIFQSIKRGFAVEIGFTQQKLSLIYVKDLTRVVIDGTLSEISNKAYFVSDGKIYDASFFNEVIAKSLNRKTINIKIPMPLISLAALVSDIGSKLSGKPNILSRDKLPEIKSRNLDCDISDLVTDLDFRPSYTLEKAVEETSKWYLENKWL